MTTENNNSEVNVEEGAGEATPTVGVARQYEIIDKVTGEVTPVERLGSGDMDNDGDADFITHREDGSQVIFTQPGYANESFLVRDRETKLSPDGVTPVADVVPEVASESVSNGSVEATYFNVYDKDGAFVRRYSSVEHEGIENAEELAKNFAGKISGTVKRS